VENLTSLEKALTEFNALWTPRGYSVCIFRTT